MTAVSRALRPLAQEVSGRQSPSINTRLERRHEVSACLDMAAAAILLAATKSARVAISAYMYDEVSCRFRHKMRGGEAADVMPHTPRFGEDAPCIYSLLCFSAQRACAVIPRFLHLPEMAIPRGRANAVINMVFVRSRRPRRFQKDANTSIGGCFSRRHLFSICAARGHLYRYKKDARLRRDDESACHVARYQPVCRRQWPLTAEVDFPESPRTSMMSFDRPCRLRASYREVAITASGHERLFPADGRAGTG